MAFSEAEVSDMASVLVKKFGNQAINIAAFFLDEHLEANDNVRAEVWMRVATYLDCYYEQRLSDTVN